MMKKTLVAVAALAATAAFAQVTISGRVAMGVSTYSATGAAAGATADLSSRTRVDDYSSRLRFSINEDLGGGLRAFGIYEMGLAYDTGTEYGQDATAGSSKYSNVGFLGSRESHIGIGNQMAEIRFGRQNVYWTQGDLSEIGSNFIGKDAFSDMYTRQANVRQNNAILLQLNSGLAGSFAGSQIYWAPEVENEAAPAGVPSSSQINNPTTYGFKLNYDQNNIHAMLDMQVRSGIKTTASDLGAAGAFGDAATSSDRTSWKAGLGYRYAPNSIVAVHYFDMLREYRATATNTAAITSSAGGNRQTGWGLTLTHALASDLKVFGAYGFLGNQMHIAGGNDLADSGSTSISLGIRKDLSKRTGIFASYGQITNGVNSSFAPTGGGFTSASTPTGADVTYSLVGMMHNF